MVDQQAGIGMAKSLVLRAMGVGAIAGLLAFIFARIFAEPVIQAAIDYESARDDVKAALAVAAGQAPEAPGPDIFSRAVQANIGIGTGMVLFGVALGCFFGVTYCLSYGRTGNIRPRQLALLVGAAGFLSLYLVPFIKYPANPPSIGNPDTIAQRGALYLSMTAATVIVTIAAVWLGQRLQQRFGTWNATLLAAAAAIVVICLVMAILPSLGSLTVNATANPGHLTETPLPLKNAAGQLVYPGFDADNLYRFRLYSVLAQVIYWTVLALGFAPLADRVFDRYGKPSQQDVAATV
jgi:Probable cobalt transporter subunit (CbtA)